MKLVSCGWSTLFLPFRFSRSFAGRSVRYNSTLRNPLCQCSNSLVQKTIRNLSCSQLRFASSLSPSFSETKSGQNSSSSTNEPGTYIEEEIFVEGVDIPAPFMKFSDYAWPEPIKKYLDNRKFPNPTSIQSQGWPICLEGRDLVGIAQTGSGKTLGYMLPAMVHIDQQTEIEDMTSSKPRVLILAPTRELAQQIDEVSRDVNYHQAVTLYGGGSRNVQRDLLENHNPPIIIATPGRLNDFASSRWIDLSEVSYFVIDEADRMLDIGFEPQIREIIKHLPSNRQTVMWTATWPEEVKNLAEEFMHNYIQIHVGSKLLHANPNIEQNIVICDRGSKDDELARILDEIKAKGGRPSENKILIFASTKDDVDWIPRRVLNRRGWNAFSIHGGKTQAAREMVLSGFKRGARQVLVATDVAARGLDVQDIRYVINYDMPQVIEDYVHRIGRTGRHGLKGVAYSLFTYEDARLAKELVGILSRNNQPVDPQLEQWAKLTKAGIRRYRETVDNRRDYGGNANRRDYSGNANRREYGRNDDRFESEGYNSWRKY
ncbi:uncharacterized protein LOC141849885 [Brevipalpus obovatus]|uniref:uncharacterized protein LOC141849885 n=1 Tax=Brevipalpus obovatus TaxID=246614 RepID=UPI003D9ED2D8